MNEFARDQASGQIAQLRELQTNRRQNYLERQRQKRDEEWSYLLDLKQIIPHIDITRESVDDHFRRDMSKVHMVSEWMMEEPQDLEDFILVPCPKGVRATFIHEPITDKKNQLAKIYGRTGHKLLEVRTNVPSDTILDCIWVKKTKTLYILDCMKYQGRDLTNCDTAFRRYWIGSKFFECRLGIMDVLLKNNNLKMNFLDGYDFTQPHRVHHCFQTFPYFTELMTELDGYLFYHKDSSYTPGESPLVLWLFPFMVDEVLSMFRVHPDYNLYKPEGYINYLDYIEKFEAQSKEKKEKKFKNRRNKAEPTNEMSFEDEHEAGHSSRAQNKAGQQGKFYEN